MNDIAQPSTDRLQLDGDPLPRLGSDGITYPIGFLHMSISESSGSIVGGLLVTDNTGVPLEFMVTTAVRPTKAQQILYGKRFKSYAAINLCGAELVRNIRTKPQVIFVADDWLLPFWAMTDIPVLHLHRPEQLGSISGRPTVSPPSEHPEYAQVIDLTSLDPDMVDAFDRIESCRELLAAKNESYRI